jgi:NDP-sugar pyrophosphorylase family protein
MAYEYDGFWMPMDTFKDKQRLDEIYAQGNAPWLLWNDVQPQTISRVAPALSSISVAAM